LGNIPPASRTPRICSVSSTPAAGAKTPKESGRDDRVIAAAAVIGTLLALAGIAVISYSPLQKNVPLRSVLAVVGGAICFAQALVLVRTRPRVHPVTMDAVGMTAGAAVLLAAASWRTTRSCSRTAPRHGPPWPTWL
jgi:drug/metabolite transporter (DMT)-like permease